MRVVLPKPGRYVVAVSGGIDSVCLLNILALSKDYKLTVAHFDHGIRKNSKQDRLFVQALAQKYALPFVYGEGNLGSMASEAEARSARYSFLNKTLSETTSLAIMTAHHQDDRIETLIINLIRGTGRKGISSLTDSELIKRPLLNVNKEELKSYANKHNLSWQEDSTNSDERYLRNYIRQRIMPGLSTEDRSRLVKIIDEQLIINTELDNQLEKMISTNDHTKLSRRTISVLPYAQSKELIATWLRLNNLINFDHKTIERLTLAAKTKRPGVKLDVYGRASITIDKEYLALHTLER